jgi:signal transduction histidine kinase
MERQVKHMVRLVDDLLEVSRITRGKIELRKEIVDIAVIVRTALEVSQPLIDAAGLQFTMMIPAFPLPLEADPIRLAQVLTNLLNNSAKYTDPGGQISLTVQSLGDEIKVSIRDTGTGIPPEMLTRVFDLFTQGWTRQRQRIRGSSAVKNWLSGQLRPSTGKTDESSPHPASNFDSRRQSRCSRKPSRSAPIALCRSSSRL